MIRIDDETAKRKLDLWESNRDTIKKTCIRIKKEPTLPMNEIKIKKEYQSDESGSGSEDENEDELNTNDDEVEDTETRSQSLSVEILNDK